MDNPDLIITIVVAISAGMALTILSDQLKIPSISFLLLGGILLGPDVLGIVNVASLGDGLRLVVAFSVGMILFEGSITLDFKGLKDSPTAIRGLLSIGVLITWFGCTAVIYYICQVPFKLALLAASLIIVTGPTVVGPLLQKVRVTSRLKHILHWEGVLIDPIGVLIAILCFQIVAEDLAWFEYLGLFILRIGVGSFFGVLGGWLISKAFQYNLVHSRILNSFAFSMVILVYGTSEILMHETGVLAVVVCGLWLAVYEKERLKPIEKFQEDIVRVIIGMVFILLASDVRLSVFSELDYSAILAIGLILVLIRPLNVFVSTIRETLKIREKLFLAWLNPRGIVAASLAALFAFDLKATHPEYSDFITRFTFLAILSTVFIQGVFTGIVATLLKVKAKPRVHWLIVGSNVLSYGIARFLQANGNTVFMLDRNINYNLYKKEDKFELISADALIIDPIYDTRLDSIGYVVGATTNLNLNMLVCQRFAEELLSPDRVMFLSTEMVSFTGMPIIIKGDSLNQVNSDIVKQRSEISTINVGSDTVKEIFKGNIELLLLKGQFGLRPPDIELLNEATQILAITKYRIPLSHYIKPEVIFMDCPSTDVVSFLSYCVDQTSKELKSISSEDIKNNLLKTEPLLSSYIGNGIAVPRIVSDRVLEPIVSIFHTKEAIEYIPSSNYKANYVFLVILPESMKDHLKEIILEIKIMSDNPKLLQKLMKAEYPGQVFMLLQ